MTPSSRSPRQTQVRGFYQHLFLLLYLLLNRDLDIFRLARTTVLHKDELWDSANTLDWVFRAVNDRHHNLESESTCTSHIDNRS